MEGGQIATLATFGDVQERTRDGRLTPPRLLLLQGCKAESVRGSQGPAPQAAGSTTSPPGRCGAPGLGGYRRARFTAQGLLLALPLLISAMAQTT